MTLKLYYDLMSQPARACYMFLKVNKIPFVPSPVALRKLEHRSDEFAAVNPFQRVPVIDDNGFVLTESMAILKYLALKYKVPEHWYPSDVQKQARIDEYLHWHHWNIRWNGSMFFITKVVKPMVTGREVDKKKVDLYHKQFIDSTIKFEKYFLGKTPFVSSNEVSIADLQALVEFMQPFAAGYDIFAERPALAAWRDRVKPSLQPHFDDAHKTLYKIARLVAQSTDNQSKL